MNAVELLMDLGRLGIRLEANGDGLRFSPRSAMTPNLAERLKAHKAELLAIVGRAADYQNAAESELQCDPATEPAAVSLGTDGWPTNSIAPDELTPCPVCGTLELWQGAAGDTLGLTPGWWRCLKCDPPTTARRLAELAEQIRRRTYRGNNARHKG